ncbi:thrombospondin-3a [Trichonephila clavipes]|nr:thrombospondin-3a [Trichonephila clavipes]
MNVTVLTGVTWQKALELSGCIVRQAAQSTQPEYEVYYNVREQETLMRALGELTLALKELRSNMDLQSWTRDWRVVDSSPDATEEQPCCVVRKFGNGLPAEVLSLALDQGFK